MTRHQKIEAFRAASPVDVAERRRQAKDWALDRIEALQSALEELKFEARINPFGFSDTREMIAVLTEIDRLTCTDTFVERIAEIEDDLSEEVA